ncbi:MFS transporter [Streptomyces sp. MP131-18]|uniref:MFS transporter n=1 Tax=Streptomyces sp. MP131-18 TaxID=1857892 RepID=UPI00097BC398|nr:MFS transporter [Streptomyces sp. MP131-18]ONK09896.1 Multidrug-efflux transporter 3 [Streptomyces sp. MP131-18]
MSPTSPVPRSGAVVGVLAGAGIVTSLMQALVVPLIPELPQLLDTTAANASWIVTVTLLAGAVATPVVGRLGDLSGKRRMLLACLAVLVVGSLICALADSLAPMIVGRALQGMSMGIIPLGISIMRDVMPPERLGSAMALMSSSLGIGGALGLPAAAAVAQNTDWHVLFWAAAALGTAVAVLVLRTVPESPVRSGGSFDLIGALVLSVGLVTLLLPISKGGDWGWSSPTTLGLFGTSAVVLLLWGAWELRIPAPLVNLRSSAKRQVLVTNLASVLVGLAMFAMMLVPVQMLQLPEATGYGLGQSMLAAGLWMAPSGLMMMVVSPLGARLSAARGPRTSLLAGALFIAFGYVIALGLSGSTWGVLIFTSVISIGIALAYAAMPALIMAAVPATETAAANGLNTLMRSIGTSTSSAVVGVLLANMTTSFGGVALPSENGFRTVLIFGACAALVATLVILAIPGRAARPASATAHVPPAQEPATTPGAATS